MIGNNDMGFTKEKYEYENVKNFCDEHELELLEDRNGWGNKVNHSKVLLKCKCGNTFERSLSNLINNQITNCPSCGDMRGARKRSSYEMNYNYFSEIDSEDKAYWLGFIMGDGSVSPKRKSIRIKLKKSDREHLKKFRDAIDSNHPIPETKQNYLMFAVYSGKMQADLAEFGVIPQKSQKNTKPNLNFDKSLYKHFWRGLIDADGCVRHDIIGGDIYPRLIFASSRLICEMFRDYCKGFVGPKKIGTYKDANLNYVTYSGSKASKLIDHFYKDAEIYLDRKYKEYQKITK